MSGSNGSISLLTLTVIATAAVAGCRCVTQAGAYAAAGGVVYGVTRTPGNVGDPIPVDILGTTIVEAGAAITKDAALMVDATGRVVPLSGAGKSPVARAQEAATAAGDFIEVLLVPSAGLVSA